MTKQNQTRITVVRWCWRGPQGVMVSLVGGSQHSLVERTGSDLKSAVTLSVYVWINKQCVESRWSDSLYLYITDKLIWTVWSWEEFRCRTDRWWRASWYSELLIRQIGPSRGTKALSESTSEQLSRKSNMKNWQEQRHRGSFILSALMCLLLLKRYSGRSCST